jgi:hypothetical protein
MASDAPIKRRKARSAEGSEKSNAAIAKKRTPKATPAQAKLVRALYTVPSGQELLGSQNLAAPKGGIEPRNMQSARREARIRHIMLLMGTPPIRWSKGVTAPLLAAAWGVSLDYVEELSAEASRRVRADVCDKGKSSEVAAVYLHAGMAEAWKQGKHREVQGYVKTLSLVQGLAPDRVPSVAVQVNVGDRHSPGSTASYSSLASMAPKQLASPATVLDTIGAPVDASDKPTASK